MKVKLGDLVKSIETIKKFGSQNNEGHVAFKLARNIRNIDAEITEFNNQARKIVERFGIQDEGNPNIFRITDANKEKYIEEMEKLSNTEIDINLVQINPKDLHEASAFDLIAIYYMLDTEEADIKMSA